MHKLLLIYNFFLYFVSNSKRFQFNLNQLSIQSLNQRFYKFLKLIFLKKNFLYYIRIYSIDNYLKQFI